MMFFWCWLLLFYLLKVFLFPGYFFMPLAHHSGFSDQWRSPSALCSTLTIFGCLLFRGFFVTSLSGFIPSVAVLRGLFLPPGISYLFSYISYLLLFPHILAHLWLRCKQEHPIQDLPLCLLSQSLPFWLALLMCQLQDRCVID